MTVIVMMVEDYVDIIGAVTIVSIFLGIERIPWTQALILSPFLLSLKRWTFGNLVWDKRSNTVSENLIDLWWPPLVAFMFVNPWKAGRTSFPCILAHACRYMLRVVIIIFFFIYTSWQAHSMIRSHSMNDWSQVVRGLELTVWRPCKVSIVSYYSSCLGSWIS